MTIIAFVAVVLVITVLIGTVSLLLFSTAADPQSPWAVAALVAATTTILGAMLLGSLRAYWNVDASREARTLNRRLLIGVTITAIAATAVLLWAGVELQSPWWVTTVAIVLSGAPLLAAPRAGDAFRRLAARQSDVDDHELDERAQLRRAVRIVSLTFVIASVAAAIAFVLLLHALGEETDGPALLILQAVGLGFVAAGIAGTIRSLPANRRLRAITRGDIALARRFGRAVLRGKPEQFTEEERAAAVEYARASILSTRLTALALPPFFVGLALQNATAIIDRPGDSQLQITVVGLLVACCAIVVPLAATQLRRAKQFLATEGSAQ